ncbi:MAG: diguanylate cyclase [Deltaproteobacteria bacterium]|nr:MAG: diguanylate cyclase [Deltaproteobacteria bacterium]
MPRARRPGWPGRRPTSPSGDVPSMHCARARSGTPSPPAAPTTDSGTGTWPRTASISRRAGRECSGWQTVNESLGHAMGDRLLASVAKRVWRCVRPGDTVARLSGDEFAVLLEDYTAAEEPRRVADRIIAEMAPPHDLGGTEVFTSASVGIAVGKPELSKPDDLLRDADVALYRAKDLGRSRYVLYNPSMRTRAREQLQFETDLRRALGRNELRIVFQPIVSLATGAATGCEALVEWQHPTRGRIPPSSSPWRRRPASSSRSGTGCCASLASRRRRGRR